MSTLPLTLRNVNKISHITTNELNNAWLKSDGRISTGAQFSNMDSRDYCVLLSQEQYDEMITDTYGAAHYLSRLRWRDKEVQTDLGTVFDAGYVAYNAPKCENTNEVQTRKPLELPEGFKGVIVRDYYKYGSTSVKKPVQVVARISNDYVTVFPTV